MRTTAAFQRFACLLITTLLALATGAIVDPVEARANSQIPGCAPNARSTDPDSARRCINGTELTSRGRLNPECLDNLKATPYGRGECYSEPSSLRGAEYIAQSRYLLKQGGSASGYGHIQAKFEWETAIPGGGRADVLEYDPGAPSPSVMSLLELKGWWNSDRNGVNQQVLGYTNALQGLGLPIVPKNVSGYADNFEIWCDSDHKDKEHYVVSPFRAGILMIYRDDSDCDRKERQKDKQDAEEAAEVDDLLGAGRRAPGLPLRLPGQLADKSTKVLEISGSAASGDDEIFKISAGASSRLAAGASAGAAAPAVLLPVSIAIGIGEVLGLLQDSWIDYLNSSSKPVKPDEPDPEPLPGEAPPEKDCYAYPDNMQADSKKYQLGFCVNNFDNVKLSYDANNGWLSSASPNKSYWEMETVKFAPESLERHSSIGEDEGVYLQVNATVLCSSNDVWNGILSPIQEVGWGTTARIVKTSGTYCRAAEDHAGALGPITGIRFQHKLIVAPKNARSNYGGMLCRSHEPEDLACSDDDFFPASQYPLAQPAQIRPYSGVRMQQASVNVVPVGFRHFVGVVCQRVSGDMDFRLPPSGDVHVETVSYRDGEPIPQRLCIDPDTMATAISSPCWAYEGYSCEPTNFRPLMDSQAETFLTDFWKCFVYSGGCALRLNVWSYDAKESGEWMPCRIADPDSGDPLYAGEVSSCSGWATSAERGSRYACTWGEKFIPLSNCAQFAKYYESATLYQYSNWADLGPQLMSGIRPIPEPVGPPPPPKCWENSSCEHHWVRAEMASVDGGGQPLPDDEVTSKVSVCFLTRDCGDAATWFNDLTEAPNGGALGGLGGVGLESSSDPGTWYGLSCVAAAPAFWTSVQGKENAWSGRDVRPTDSFEPCMQEWRELSGVDSVASSPVTVSGKVTGDEGPIADACVYLYDSRSAAHARYASCVGGDGSYMVSGIDAGTYEVAVTEPSGNFLRQWRSTPLTVPAFGRQGIDFTLSRRSSGTISGRLVSLESGHGLSNVCVYAYVNGESSMANYATCTDMSGNYQMFDVEAGSYNLAFADATGSYPTQWFTGRADNAATQAGAAAVSVTPSGTLTANSVLREAANGVVRGTVTADGSPAPEACVYLYDSVDEGTGAAKYGTCTAEDGTYYFGDVPAGSYKVAFAAANFDRYVTQWYSGAPGGVSSWEAATAVIVRGGRTLSAVDAAMAVVPGNEPVASAARYPARPA